MVLLSVNNHFWYLSLSLLIALIFLCAQKYSEKLGFFQIFFGEKNRQTSVLYPTRYSQQVPIFPSSFTKVASHSLLSFPSSYCISDFSDPKRSLFCIEEDIQVLYKIKVIVHISIAKSILLLDR